MTYRALNNCLGPQRLADQLSHKTVTGPTCSWQSLMLKTITGSKKELAQKQCFLGYIPFPLQQPSHRGLSGPSSAFLKEINNNRINIKLPFISAFKHRAEMPKLVLNLSILFIYEFLASDWASLYLLSAVILYCPF